MSRLQSRYLSLVLLIAILFGSAILSPSHAAVIFEDNLNGAANTLLDAHTPDVAGSGWTLLSGAGPNIILNGSGVANAISNQSSTSILYSADPAPTEADVHIIVDMDAIDASNDDPMNLVFRYQDASNFYGLKVTASNAKKMRLYKVIGGINTLLGTSANKPDSTFTSFKIQAR